MRSFEKALSIFTNKLGFKVAGERGYDAGAELESALQDETMGAAPLAHNLLYDAFDNESGIAFNKGSLGCWFEISPIIGSKDSIEKNLTLFFNEELPENGYVQFMVLASNDIEQVMNLWENGRISTESWLDRLTQYRKGFIKNLSEDYKNANDGRFPRQYRFFISYSMQDKGESSLDIVLAFKKKFFNKLKTEGFGPRLCVAEDLIKVGREILQMQPSMLDEGSRHTKYDPKNDISEQISRFPFRNIVEEDKIVHVDTGMSSRVLFPSEIPESFSLSEMIQLLGDEYKTIPARFIISYSIANNLGKSGTSAIITKGDRSIHAASKSYTKDDIIAQEEASEWVRIKALHKKGEIFLSDSMLVMITTPSNMLEDATESIRSLYNAIDWKMNIASSIQRLCVLSMLPMMQSSYFRSLRFFKLAKYALSGEVVAKLPMQGEWCGVPRSGALLMGRRGQLFNFNPYYRIGGGGNYNICMMAPSGSGKSFLLQEIAQSMLASGVAVFVMDIGASYKNMCQSAGGEMVRFNHASNISLNPFASLSNSGIVYVKANELIVLGKSIEEISNITGLSIEKIQALKQGVNKDGIASEADQDAIEIMEIIDATDQNKRHFVTKDSVIYAKSMVSAMCSVSGDSRGEALIERAIIDGIAIYGSDLDITKLSQILSQLKDKDGNNIGFAGMMADSLYPYTEDGIHGRYFASGRAPATFNEMLTVFELEELVNDEPLLAVVLQIALMQITMQFLCGDRTKRFMLIVDEAWMILDYAAVFLERFARTVRKYGGSLVVCTQDLSSFSNECGKRKSQAAVLESSTWKMILQQKAEGIATFAKSRAYEKYLGLISSVRKCSENKFSEVLINTDGATIVGRFATDPYSTALFSTESDDYAYLMQAEKQGIPKHEAILELSKKYGKLPDIEQLSNKEIS